MLKRKSKNKTIYYIAESYRDKDGRSTSRIVKRLGSEQEIIELLKLNPDDDVESKVREYVVEFTAKAKSNAQEKITRTFKVNTSYVKGDRRSFNVGYLFLQKILFNLNFEQMVADICKRHQLEYKFGDIFANLIYSRILDPNSELSSLDFCRKYFYEVSDFDIKYVYNTLDILNKENDTIQDFAYKGIQNILELNKEVLYYDCSTLYFETSVANKLRTYGGAKENCSDLILQRYLFMDDRGIPLSLVLKQVNTNNNRKEFTFQSHELKVINDLNFKDNFIIHSEDILYIPKKCTLSKYKPFRLMDKDVHDWAIYHGRPATQFPLTPIENKEAKREIKQNGWRRCDNFIDYLSIDDIDESDPANLDRIFYKECQVSYDKNKVNDNESIKISNNKSNIRLMVNYSIKYKHMMQKKRELNIEIAKRLIKDKNFKIDDLNNSNDIKRYIKENSSKVKEENQIRTDYVLNLEEIGSQSIYDGFYPVEIQNNIQTNTINYINNILLENKIAFDFIMLKFKSRLAYFNTEHIPAFSLIIFMALLVERILEQIVNSRQKNTFTISQIVSELRKMNITKADQFFIGNFKRTDLTDTLQEKMELKFDCEFITQELMDKNLKQSKNSFTHQNNAS